MTIPEKLKIGAKVYGVEITNKLDLGNVNYSGVFAPVKEGQHENVCNSESEDR